LVGCSLVFKMDMKQIIYVHVQIEIHIELTFDKKILMELNFS
jgi:hypothetical protein